MYEQLKLENQLCFPVYAASRLITRMYQPMLSKLGITYPQYLVLMLLWEKDGLNVNDISKKLLLNTNTITPLLQRMEKQNLLHRIKSKKDERSIQISLSQKGILLKEQAKEIPGSLLKNISESNINLGDLLQLKNSLNSLIKQLSK